MNLQSHTIFNGKIPHSAPQDALEQPLPAWMSQEVSKWLVPESSEGVKFVPPKTHQKQTRGLKLDSLGRSR